MAKRCCHASIIWNSQTLLTKESRPGESVDRLAEWDKIPMPTQNRKVWFPGVLYNGRLAILPESADEVDG